MSHRDKKAVHSSPGPILFTAAFAFVLSFIPFAVQSSEPSAATITKASSASMILRQPLVFEANEGQTDYSVKFLSRGSDYTLFLTPEETVLDLHQHSANRTGDDAGPVSLRMKLLGANTKPHVIGENNLLAKHHYIIGNKPKQWHTDIPTFGRVHYQDVYKDIDLVYYGHEGTLEYDFIVAPQADPNAIHLSFKGAKDISLDADGNLILHTSHGDVIHRRPYAYQDLPDGRHAVAAKYRLHNVKDGTPTVTFQLATYDSGSPLIIDPVLNYTSFLGGSGADEANAIVVDSDGNFYVTGSTLSTDFPADNGVNTSYISSDLSSDVFISKFDNAGTLVFSTYLGAKSNSSGFGDDVGTAIAVDSSGQIYVTGYTNSFNNANPFPTTPTNAYHKTPIGNYDVFVTVLANDGSSLIYSTYIGGSGGDEAYGIALDTTGNIYVTGMTKLDFPTVGAYQASGDGNTNFGDAFIFKLDPSQNGTAGLIYSTYLGGSSDDIATAIAIDSSGNAYVTGQTVSTDFPLVNPYQNALAGTNGVADAFVAKLDAYGNSLIYSTYLGGSGKDTGLGIAVDDSGNAYVAGISNAWSEIIYDWSVSPPTETTVIYDGDFPVTTNAYDTVMNNGDLADGFVTKFAPDGTALTYSTYLGGSASDEIRAIAVDSYGAAYVAGWTSSGNFPEVGGILSNNNSGGKDVFASELWAAGNGLEYSGMLGGTGDDQANGIALSNSGLYLTGWTKSADLPFTTDAAQKTSTDNYDAFVARIEKFADMGITLSDDSPVVVNNTLTYTVTVHNYSTDTATGIAATVTLPSTGVSYINADAGCAHNAGTVTCDMGSLGMNGEASADIFVTVTSTSLISTTATVSASEADSSLSNNSATLETTASESSSGGGGGTIITSGGGSGGTTSNSSSGGGGSLNLFELLLGWGIASAARRRRLF
jgi:uncharacterized repeat protein (TIGR01451 family)